MNARSDRDHGARGVRGRSSPRRCSRVAAVIVPAWTRFGEFRLETRVRSPKRQPDSDRLGLIVVGRIRILRTACQWMT